MLLMLHIQRLLVVRILVTLATHHVRCRSLSATEVLSTGRMSLTDGRPRRQVGRWSSDSSHIEFCLTTSSGILGLKIVCSVVLLLGSIASGLGCRWAGTNLLLWHLAGIYLSLVGKLSRGSTLSIHSKTLSKIECGLQQVSKSLLNAHKILLRETSLRLQFLNGRQTQNCVL
jgi:hypothetical protein